MNSDISVCYSQLRPWGIVIRDTYRHSIYQLNARSIEGIGHIDFVHMSHWLFGNSLVSMPFSDAGGFSTTEESIEQKLFCASLELATQCRAQSIELRMDRPLSWLNQEYLDQSGFTCIGNKERLGLSIQTHKVKMVLELPGSAHSLMEGFKSKLRSQIRKPIKEGMIYRVGKKELIDDFYKVFAVNMRDLGSPVHSKQLFLNVLKAYHGQSDLILVYSKKGVPVAGAMVIGNGDTLSNPWASSLKEYRAFSPNMLLYWGMMKYAIERSYRQFDFGRSTPGEGTHAFKEQWGAKAIPLYWYIVSRTGRREVGSMSDDSSLHVMVKLWQRLPVSISQFFGPIIRKDISL